MNISHVYVMMIFHKHGETISVHTTRRGAESCLAIYCKKQWDLNQYEKDRLVGLSDQDVILQYFHLDNNCGGYEWVDIQKRELIRN